jgi:hypothetical protein
LLERDSFDLFLPEFDKPWVIHLRETCCCSTNLCTWRPNTVYKDRSVRRHHGVLDILVEEDVMDEVVVMHVAVAAKRLAKVGITPFLDIVMGFTKVGNTMLFH